VSPRPYWKGYLKLSLVSCPISVYAACSSSERIFLSADQPQDRQPAAPDQPGMLNSLAVMLVRPSAPQCPAEILTAAARW
jgi:hypothetical protein